MANFNEILAKNKITNFFKSGECSSKILISPVVSPENSRVNTKGNSIKRVLKLSPPNHPRFNIQASPPNISRLKLKNTSQNQNQNQQVSLNIQTRSLNEPINQNPNCSLQVNTTNNCNEVVFNEKIYDNNSFMKKPKKQALKVICNEMNHKAIFYQPEINNINHNSSRISSSNIAKDSIDKNSMSKFLSNYTARAGSGKLKEYTNRDEYSKC